MTCIVGMVDKQNDKVIIGGDSAGVLGTGIVLRKDEKVFKNGDFVIGCTSSFRMIQLLRYSFTPPEIKDGDIFKYMCTDFVNEIRKVFDEGGFLQKYKSGDDMGGTFLVGYKNRLFKIEDDFQVSETLQGYDACGSGADVALGSIYTNEINNIKKRVEKALEAASNFNTGVAAPFTIYST